MCKLKDIIVVNKYKAENKVNISKHSFVVIDDVGGTIRGLDYDLVMSVISSYKSTKHKIKIY